jgi:alpha-D-ribose 1-methylphosphonate 5-triphosphate synthase subunit PhnL
VAAEPLLACGVARDVALQRAGNLLARLNVPERLRGLPPATFSGGEQQRVNIARGLVGAHCVLLLDEPTASLDEANREIVLNLINERKRHGTTVVAIVHDADARDAIADRIVDVSSFAAAA